MVRRAGVQPTESNGAVANDVAGRSSAPAVEPALSVPLTIREVVRRGRAEREELDRLRAEIEQLRLRAESAEELLRTAPDQATPHEPDPHAQNGHGPADGDSRPDRQRKRPPTDATHRWAPAAVLPRSRQT